MLLQQVTPPASCQGGTIDCIVGKLNIEAIVGKQVYCRHGWVLDDEDIMADDMVEAADSGDDTIPVLHTEAVVQDKPALVHATHPQSTSGRCNIAIVNDIARPVGPMRIIFRWRGPQPIPIASIGACGFYHAILHEILICPP